MAFSLVAFNFSSLDLGLCYVIFHRSGNKAKVTIHHSSSRLWKHCIFFLSFWTSAPFWSMKGAFERNITHSASWCKEGEKHGDQPAQTKSCSSSQLVSESYRRNGSCLKPLDFRVICLYSHAE